tara:strand:- start:4710 stop:5453 length:744 start_codon:yes stop_codon:yes gene_type:complete
MFKDIEYFIKNKILTEKYLLKKRLKRSILNNYELELNFLEQFKDKNKDAIDIGVYRGVYSYKLSKLFNHIYAYEPNPLIYPYLKKNLTQIISNITLSNYALSNNDGDAMLRIPNRTKSLFKNNIEELYKLGCATIHKQNNFDNYKAFSVKKKKLDEMIFKKKIGFIKIDVEGHENEVIQGAEKLLKNNKPVLLVEIEERHSKKKIIYTIKYIKSLGYECFFVKNSVLTMIDNLTQQDKNNNFYFLPK